MNNQRRQAITKAIEMLSTLDLIKQELLGQLADVRDFVESINEAEQEAFDNMPEGLQESDKGQTMQECISKLEEVFSALEELHSVTETTDFSDLTTTLEEAKA